MTQEILTMHTYIRKSSEIPEQGRSQGGTRELYAEWETRQFNFLRTIGYSDSEILNMPLIRANLLFCAHLEETGAATFKSRAAYAREDRMSAILDAEERKEGFAA